MSGIIDGTGSLGAALGQLAIGWLQSKTWNGVFIMLAVMVFLAALPLLGLFWRDVKEIRIISRERRAEKQLKKEEDMGWTQEDN